MNVSGVKVSSATNFKSAPKVKEESNLNQEPKDTKETGKKTAICLLALGTIGAAGVAIAMARKGKTIKTTDLTKGGTLVDVKAGIKNLTNNGKAAIPEGVIVDIKPEPSKNLFTKMHNKLTDLFGSKTKDLTKGGKLIDIKAGIKKFTNKGKTTIPEGVIV